MMETEEKPPFIRWLEEETGEEIPYTPEEPGAQPRHLSVRLPDDLAAGMDLLAAERGVTASQLVRDLLTEALAKRGTTAAIDAEDLVDRMTEDLAEIRRRLAS